MKNLYLLVIIPLLTLAGCGLTKPTESQAEEAFKADVTRESSGRIEVVAFKTTASHGPDDAGESVHMFDYEYTATVRTKADYMLNAGQVFGYQQDDHGVKAANGTSFDVKGSISFTDANGIWKAGKIVAHRQANASLDNLKPVGYKTYLPGE